MPCNPATSTVSELPFHTLLTLAPIKKKEGGGDGLGGGGREGCLIWHTAALTDTG